MKTHGFLLGADYKLHKQVVLFVEGKYVTKKEYVADTYNGKVDVYKRQVYNFT